MVRLWRSSLLLFIMVAILGIIPCDGVVVTNIRLMNGNSVSVRVGRIEIQVNNINTWGSICDDGFDRNDAIVACRMLGYTNGGNPVLNTTYGTGSHIYLMDDSGCTGDEKNLTECTASQTSDCSYPADVEVGVECNENLGTGQVTPAPSTTTTAASSIISGNCQSTNPTVKLYGKQGIDGMGYVQVLSPNNTWGYVCDDSWSASAAAVVCAQLCYPKNYTAKPGIPAENKLRPANPVIILDNVVCSGTEATLQNCSHSAWFSSDCRNDEDELAGVQCVAAPYQPPPPPVPILTCGQGLLAAQFSRIQDPNLEEKHLSILSQPNCTDATKSTTTNYVSITVPVEKCGTTISRNGTHINYANVIKYDYTSQEEYITRVNSYRIEILCSLPIDEKVTDRVQPVTETVTQKATGAFTTSMQIYRSDSFATPVTETPVTLPLGEWLNMAISMEEYDSRLKLVVTTCVSTPTGNVNGTVKKVLFQDKCSQESTLSFYPLTNFKFGFRFKPFKFVGYDILYLQCDAIICLASDNTKECDRTCNNTKPVNATSTGRRKRSDAKIYTTVKSQPIILYSIQELLPETTPGRAPVVLDGGEVTTTVPPPVTQQPQELQQKPGTSTQSSLQGMEFKGNTDLGLRLSVSVAHIVLLVLISCVLM
ncbi:deleted in malignant brain tumors 1 protein-like [Physella acuta]|uniref:deleted in malignant brain tumors 1 protein-like n=1 Tax=Physella acuta TaxID=109671 RepID=UPI0027DE481E|nr:deleted in malignant brain tumors 1 protein-like [Physella acuta]